MQSRRLRHLRDRSCSVTPFGMRLQVAPQSRCPLRRARQQLARCGNRQKTGTDFGNVGEWWWVIEPAVDHALEMRTDARELGERSPVLIQQRGLNGPHERAPRRASQRLLKGIAGRF